MRFCNASEAYTVLRNIRDATHDIRSEGLAEMAMADLETSLDRARTLIGHLLEVDTTKASFEDDELLFGFYTRDETKELPKPLWYIDQEGEWGGQPEQAE